MNLVGIKVKHKAFGAGKVTELDAQYVTIAFEAKTTKFVFPDCFENFVKAEDASVQSAIDKMIVDAKIAEEQKKQEEETARKATEEQRSASIATPASKAKKTLDEMFAPDYHAEKLARQPILIYQQVEEQFGIRISGFGRGINPTDNTVVLISSIGKASGNFVYHDKWTLDGDYLYSGEGKTGDQTMTKGNLAIRDAARNGNKIHLFVKFSPQDFTIKGFSSLLIIHMRMKGTKTVIFARNISSD